MLNAFWLKNLERLYFFYKRIVIDTFDLNFSPPKAIIFSYTIVVTYNELIFPLIFWRCVSITMALLTLPINKNSVSWLGATSHLSRIARNHGELFFAEK